MTTLYVVRKQQNNQQISVGLVTMRTQSKQIRMNNTKNLTQFI